MLLRSPIWAFTSTVSSILSTGTDSPVRGASSTRRFLTSQRRMSAGILSPDCSRTTSPGTSSSAGIIRVFPSRRAMASAESMLRIESRAFSAFLLNKAKQGVDYNNAENYRASNHSPSKILPTPAASST